MKKLVLALAAVAVMAMVAAPAMAATQWNFGGMIRYATFWDQSKGGEGFLTGDLQGGGAYVKNDGALTWGTQANTRLMIWMKSDSLEGFIELGYDFDANSVTTREYWGRYQINDNLGILIGQQHQLYSSFISRQAGLIDLNMNGVGTAFRPPTPKIAINYGGTGGFGPFGPTGFSFALVKPETEESGLAMYNLPVIPMPDPDATVLYDEDTYLPQIQASYAYAADTWRMKIAGAYQWTKIKDIEYMGWEFSDKNIHTWLVALEGEISFGPLWLAANVSAGQNWGNAGLMNSEFGNTHKGSGFDSWGDFADSMTSISSAKIDWNGKLKNTTSVMASVVAAYQLTEALRFEAGVGYRYDDNKLYHKSSNIWTAYIQAAYTIAPGFEVVPEIGYIDRGKSVWYGEDKGYLWYAGAQWNMYF